MVGMGKATRTGQFRLYNKHKKDISFYQPARFRQTCSCSLQAWSSTDHYARNTSWVNSDSEEHSVNTIQLAYWNTCGPSDIRHRRSRDMESSSAMSSVYGGANEEHKQRRISV